MLGFFALAGFGFKEVVDELQTRRWPQTPCEIIESKVESNSGYGRSGYVPLVRYRYQVGGRTYVSERIHIKPELTHSDYSGAAARLTKYPRGAKLTCYVNPRDPHEAVLESKPDFVVFAVSPCLLLIWAIYERVALIDWFLARREKRRGSSAQPITANTVLRRSEIQRLMVGGIGLIISCLFAAGAWVWPWLQTRRAANWVAQPCTIVRIGVGAEIQHQGGRSFKPEVLYTYEFKGVRYESSRLDFSFDLYFSYATAQDVVAKYKPGQETTAFVDPKDPRRSVLQRTFHSNWFLNFFIIGFTALSVFLIGHTLAGQRARSSVFPWENSKVRAAAVADRAVLTVDKPAGAMVGWFLLGAGVCLAFSIWLLGNSFRSWRDGEFEVLPLLYGVGTAIGFCVCIWKIARYWPQVRARPPRLVIEPAMPHLGQPFTIEWESNRSADHEFRLSIEGQEEAVIPTTIATIHGESREERTERVTFRRIPLTGMDRFETAQFGQYRAAVPLDSMHSFEANKVRIVWLVRAEVQASPGRILNYEYKIIVQPAAANPHESASHSA